MSHMYYPSKFEKMYIFKKIILVMLLEMMRPCSSKQKLNFFQEIILNK